MKYLFVGNRRFVLDSMLELNLDIVKIVTIANTHIEKDLRNLDLPYSSIKSKRELLKIIEQTDFDILISNGCPYILPISRLPKNKKFINIHPSYLPDLRGVDPVIGAIIHKRDAGASCHVMNDKIDAGDIISQVKIPFSPDLDVSLLYQLSFIAEKNAFMLAHENNYISKKAQIPLATHISYKRSLEDQSLTFNESNEEIICKIKAFNNYSQGCTFQYHGQEYKVFQASIITNQFATQHAYGKRNFEIIFKYEDCIVFKKDNELIKLQQVRGDFSKIIQGTLLTET